MIKSIIGYGKSVSFVRTDKTIETLELTYDEWGILTLWIQDEVYSSPSDKPTWICNPLVSSPGGFIAQKLITF